MKLKFSILFAALFVAALLPVASTRAEAQGRHPGYLHALSDLRLARAYLGRLTPNENLQQEQQNAIHEIEEAIGDIKRASIDDGKDINAHMPIDAHIEPRNRFQKARDALDAALRDVSQEEDDPMTKGLQHRSQEHIHKAMDSVRSIQAHAHLL
jgi:hypothetical protein